MPVTVKYTLFELQNEKQIPDSIVKGKTRNEVMDHASSAILFAVQATVMELSYLRKEMPSEWIKTVHRACNNTTSFPFSVEFEDGTVEESLVDVSAEALSDYAISHMDKEMKEELVNHVRTCVNPVCPVNDFFVTAA